MPDKKIARRAAAKPKESMTGIMRAVGDFLKFDAAAKGFATQADEVKLRLRDQVLVNQGVEDENHHRWIMFDEGTPIEDPAGKPPVIGIKRQRSAPKTLNSERAEEFLRRKKLWDQCTETITVINEDAILAVAFAKGITEDELQALYDVKETWSFIPVRAK